MITSNPMQLKARIKNLATKKNLPAQIAVLSPYSRNIKRGGWLGYVDNGNNYRDLRRGSVKSWYIIVKIWDSSLVKNVDYYQSSFDYLVTVN